MIRPEKMKQVEITVLERDVDNVIKYLGRYGVLQFSYTEKGKRERNEEEREAVRRRGERLDQIKECARFLEVELPVEPSETIEPAGEAEDTALQPLITAISALEHEEYNTRLESERIDEQLRALQGFEKISDHLDDSEQFSFLNLKIGHLEPKKQTELLKNMGERAVVVPLSEEGDGVVIATSKKGRFSLDTELKKQDFTPVHIPENLKTPPSEMVNALQLRRDELPAVFSRIEATKNSYRETFSAALQNLYSAYFIAGIIDDIKGQLVSTKNAWLLTGWIPARTISRFVGELEALTGGRIAVSSFDAWEAPSVREGREKIPVSLRHGGFARSFEPLVFSYGAPLYGAIDPTPITAFFFTLLFAIMFGDVGQGFVLLVLGFLAGNKALKCFENHRHFAAPLKAIGVASMITGLIYGSVFSNEELLHGPTEWLTGLLAHTAPGAALGITPTGTLLNLMPHADNMDKIFAFFGCTIAVGIILNSIGLIINIMNKCALHHWEKAFFSKNGVAGIVFFWYAVSLAVRALIQRDSFVFGNFDMIMLVAPVGCIVFGPLIWRIIARKRPLFHEGIFAFAIEGIVEILETLSGYISNTVSFLRVGAFALSHAVLSFIIWTMADKVHEVVLGTLWSAIIVIFGNVVIIVLEGMIVAIQVTRLQYYEFFSKFFTETGSTYTPFRFVKKK
ncbi:MAG: V-type ATP synthase subunit I [Spirochaetaceae bacterium]|jgi:V/A-type H+-transporting ATPase subunit I|nr:V-type ATP synthase subunit I [Spirochaetaceae bacterium]